MIPQLILIVLWSLGLGIAIAEHGHAKTKSHNAWTTVIGTIITALILYYGGFWQPLTK